MPTALRRPAAVASVLFVLILAFLAGRVHAGADPTQATTPAVPPALPAAASPPAPLWSRAAAGADRGEGARTTAG